MRPESASSPIPGAGYGGGSVWTYDVARQAIIRIDD